MNTLWAVLVLLTVLGMLVMLPLMELVNNDPGYGSLAGGVVIAVAILLHALTNLMVSERESAGSASKQDNEEKNA